MEANKIQEDSTEDKVLNMKIGQHLIIKDIKEFDMHTETYSITVWKVPNGWLFNNVFVPEELNGK